MPQFTYHATETATGLVRQGVLTAVNRETATTILKARGLSPTKLFPQPGSDAQLKGGAGVQETVRSRRWASLGRGISGTELAVFTRQLAMLVRAGMPLLRSLEVLGRQERNHAMQRVIEQMAEHIRGGGTFSESLQQHPHSFDRLYVNMVRAGEAGGVLGVVLGRLAQFIEKSIQLRGRIKSAMIYPLIVIVMAVTIVLALMTFVVPKFEAIFAGTLKGQALPMLTQWVMGASNLIQNHALLTLFVGAACIALGRLIAGTRLGKYWLDRATLRLPLAGTLVLKTAIARFTRTFGTLLSSGVPILQALAITRDTSGNTQITNAIQTVHDRVKEGDGVAGPLRAAGVFPDMVASMIEVGEETGALPEMLARVADIYDEEVERAVAALTTIIEPLMIVLMAIMVGTIVIALFLPIIHLVQSLG